MLMFLLMGRNWIGIIFLEGRNPNDFKLLENRGFQIVDKKKKVVVDQEKSFSSDLKKFLAQSQAGELRYKRI